MISDESDSSIETIIDCDDEIRDLIGGVDMSLLGELQTLHDVDDNWKLGMGGGFAAWDELRELASAHNLDASVLNEVGK